MSLTFAEVAQIPLDQLPPWPECLHHWRPAHNATEYRDLIDNHLGGLCDPATCHWCADDRARDRATVRGVNGPQLRLGL